MPSSEDKHNLYRIVRRYLAENFGDFYFQCHSKGDTVVVTFDVVRSSVQDGSAVIRLKDVSVELKERQPVYKSSVESASPLVQLQ